MANMNIHNRGAEKDAYTPQTGVVSRENRQSFFINQVSAHLRFRFIVHCMKISLSSSGAPWTHGALLFFSAELGVGVCMRKRVNIIAQVLMDESPFGHDGLCMLNNERIMVTGCAGFIGSHLCESLVALGARVIGVDNFDPYYGRERKEQNLESIRAADSNGRFGFRELDICDLDALSDAMRSIDATGVIHLAAKAGVRPSIEDPGGYARANVLGTQSVLSAASGCGCERVVCASSSSVYGNNTKVPFAETDAVNHPISPYAATKVSCELIAHAHHHLTNLPIAMLRFFTVFGPRQRPDLAMSLFLDKISRSETINRFGDGTTSRDYTFVGDIVAGIVRSYERIDGFGYRIWNLGGDHPTTLNELIATVGEIVGKEPVVNEMGMQAGDVERTWADLSRSRDELGYSPSTSVRDGLIAQWAWMNANAGLAGNQ
jgi:UDP-glucuronate 4-epimerase